MMFKLMLIGMFAFASDYFIDFRGNKVIIEKDGRIFVYELTKKDMEALLKNDSKSIVDNICEKYKCPKK